MQILDELMSYAMEPSNSEQLKSAREKYFGVLGQVFEDDPDFEQRMNNFLEWFIFDYKSGGAETTTLYEKYIDSQRRVLAMDELVFKMNIGKHRYSIFSIIRCGNGMIYVKDIADNSRYHVTAEDNLEKGDLLQTRLIKTDKGCFFTHTYCLHPKQAYKYIKAEIKKRKRSGLTPEFFLSLNAKQLTWRRSRKINIEDIYRF